MSKKIKIAIIAGQLVVGGAEKQLYLWLANLDRNRYNPIVVTLHPGHEDYWEKPIEDLGIPIYRVKRNKNRFFRLIEIIQILRPYHPDLIHGWHNFASTYTCMASKVLRTKSLGGIRSSFDAIVDSKETRLTRLFCDAVVSNSYSAAEAYKKDQKWKKQPVFTVHNAIHTQFINRLEARKHFVNNYNLPPEAIWICSMGRMYPSKRFDILVELTSNLKREFNNIHVILIGDGPENSKLKEMAHELNLQKDITFTGEVPEASKWLMGMDIFCSPSLSEGLPNVIMEASAAGLSVVAWNLPSIEELLINDSMGYLIKTNDLIKMKEALRLLIMSESLRARLGSKAKDHIKKHFSLDRYVEGLTSVYEQLVT